MTDRSTPRSSRSGTSARDPDEIWRRYFETLAAAARSGLFDVLAHPDLIKVWGRAQTDCRRAIFGSTTSPRSRRSPSPASRLKSRQPDCARPSARSTRLPASWRCASRPGRHSRSPPTRTSPARLGFEYPRALEFLGSARGRGDCRLRRPSAASPGAGRGGGLVPVSVGIGYDSHRFGEDRPLILGGVEVAVRAWSGRPLRRRRADPRGDRRDPRCRRARRHRRDLPRQRPTWEGADSIGSARPRWSAWSTVRS